LFEGSAVKIYRSLRIDASSPTRISRSDGPIKDARFDSWDSSRQASRSLRDRSGPHPDPSLSAAPILPWALPLSGFAGIARCTLPGTTPTGPTASVFDAHAFVGRNEPITIRSWALRKGRDDWPDLSPVTSLPIAALQRFEGADALPIRLNGKPERQPV